LLAGNYYILNLHSLHSSQITFLAFSWEKEGFRRDSLRFEKETLKNKYLKKTVKLS